MHGILVPCLTSSGCCYFDMMDKLQKLVCRTVIPILTTSLEHLAHPLNVASVSLFFRYYSGRCSSKLAELVSLLYFRGRSTLHSDSLHNFSITILRCYKDVYTNSFFPRTARLYNFLPAEYFSLTYNLNSFCLELIDTFYLYVFSRCLSCIS